MMSVVEPSDALQIAAAIELLGSASFRAEAAIGRVELEGPVSDNDLQRMEESTAVVEAILPLLRASAGFKIFDRTSSDVDPILAVDFRELGSGVWQGAYPAAVEMVAFDELLYWDLRGSNPGAIFFVDHEGPTHTHAFDSLTQLLETVKRSTPESLAEHLQDCSRGEPKAVSVSAFETDDRDLEAFLGRFPAYFSVQDLRMSSIGDHFEYGLAGPDGLLRWSEERLFVQRQPANWRQHMRWWWNANVPLSLPPIGQEF